MLYRRVLSIHGVDPVIYAKTLMGLRTLVWDKGTFSEAEQFFQELLLFSDKNFGMESAQAADALRKLSQTARVKGDFLESRRLGERALETGSIAE